MSAAPTLHDLAAALPSLDGEAWAPLFAQRALLSEARGAAGDRPARLARTAVQVVRALALRLAGDAVRAPSARELELARGLTLALRADDAEATQLAALVQAADLPGDGTMLHLAALAYAQSLAAAARWEEALVFAALAARAPIHLAPRDLAAVALLAGRARAALDEWETAAVAYAVAERAALAAGDAVSAARAALGLAETSRGRGDVVDAEARAARLLAATPRAALAEIRAEALHLLGDVQATQGRAAEAVETIWRALAHAEGPRQATRILRSLGRTLSACGAVTAARTAWALAADGPGDVHERAEAYVALLDLDAQRGDRLAFERVRRALLPLLPALPPIRQVEAEHRLGLGYARFGRRAAAQSAFSSALATAQGAQLLQWQGALQRAAAQLVTGAVPAAPAAESGLPPIAARVAHGLAALVAARSA